MKDLLLNYTRYNLWANKCLADTMEVLSDEQVNREMVSSFPTIRKTVFHLWGAEDIWKRRLMQVEGLTCGTLVETECRITLLFIFAAG